MKNQYVRFNNRYILIKYRQENPNWTWMISGWLGDTRQITPEIMQYASHLEEEMQRLDELAGQKFLNQYIIDS
ncbi:MAG: hypothetical protein IJU76_12695 [Desulfovibrionaceae bacterium]|nr:hypothetical protein [Desulfovibrionaceae bacterium]